MKQNAFFILLKILLIAQMSRFIATAEASELELILFIMGDDIGPADFGFKLPTSKSTKYIVKTPFIDQLKTNSALFPNVEAAAVCGPSRASFLTGRPQTASAWRGNVDTTKNHKVPYSLPQALTSMGWKTIISGKFGFGDCATNQSVYNFGFNASLYFSTHISAHYPFPSYLNKDCNDIVYKNNKGTSASKCLQGKCISANDEFLDFTIKQIEQCVQNNQRCAIFHMPTYAHVGKYSPSHNRVYYPVNNYEQYPKSWATDIKGYAAMITKFDRQVGTIMRTLEQLNKRNSTLTFIFSDNGAECFYTNGKQKCNLDPFESNGGRRGKKRSMYQGGLVTPVIANWPGVISSSSSSDFPWALHDLALTTLDILQAPPAIIKQFAASDNIQEGVAISVAKLLLHGEQYAKNRNFLFAENCEKGEASCTYAVFDTRDWQNTLPKLVCNTPKCEPELYDLKSDPAESKNLARLPGYEAKVTELLTARKNNRLALN